MLIWFAIFLYALLLLALVYVWIDIIRLFISRRYRQCPPLVPSFGRQKKVMIEKNFRRTETKPAAAQRS